MRMARFFFLAMATSSPTNSITRFYAAPSVCLRHCLSAMVTIQFSKVPESARKTRILRKLCTQFPFVCCVLCPTLLYASPATKQISQLPWYMRATAMTNDGRLTFLEQPWWPRSQKLAEGQSFTLDLNHDGRPDTIITRCDDDIIEA